MACPLLEALSCAHLCDRPLPRVREIRTLLNCAIELTAFQMGSRRHDVWTRAQHEQPYRLPSSSCRV